MLSNLPDGVTDSMIPGNRPQDVAWDDFIDWLSGLDASPDEIRTWIEDGLYSRKK